MLQMISKIRLILTAFISLLFVFLISFISSFSYEVHLDSLISTYKTEFAQVETRFVHTRITRSEGNQVANFNQTSLNAQQTLSTNLIDYSSYLTFEKNNVKDFEFANEEKDLAFKASVMYLPMRYDINREFMESIRLRQFRTNVESRFVYDDFDFSFFISSLMADQIIAESHGQFTNYDQILDYETRGLDFTMNVDGSLKEGHIRNIFFVEEMNKVSMSLDYYLGNFVVFYGPKDVIFEGYDYVLNYDFLSSNNSIENHLSFLGTYGFDNIHFYDNNDNVENNDLNQIYRYILLESGEGQQILFYLIIVILFLGLYYIALTNKIGLYSKEMAAHVSLQLIAVIMFYVLIKIMQHISDIVLFSFGLSNYVFGIISMCIIFLALVYFYQFFRKVRNFKQTNSGQENL